MSCWDLPLGVTHKDIDGEDAPSTCAHCEHEVYNEEDLNEDQLCADCAAEAEEKAEAEE